MKDSLSQDFLKDILDYDPITGILKWKPRNPSHFTGGPIQSVHHCTRWNARYAGGPFGSVTHHGRYRSGMIGGRRYLAHRLIWKIMTGEDPLDTDHIDGNGLNNQYSNLRSVSTSCNMKNARLRFDNKSGCHGVQWFPSTNRWRVRITGPNGRQKHIGFFKDLEMAKNARKMFEIYYGGYHENHGRIVSV